ncbi:MAG: DUF3885 domain-containing protein [Oscillospiraceae bacterium]|nr:DUF3885 domain-containing protein [Oscillospiraceae bacterium]
MEEQILSRDFDYLQPYFYNNPYALRCELGIGNTTEEYLSQARQRANAIYDILFSHGADAIIFNYWINDWSDSGETEGKAWESEEIAAEIVDRRIQAESDSLRFLSEHMMKYRHVAVKNLKTYDEPGDPDYDLRRRHRIVCYSDGIGFDDRELIEKQLSDGDSPEISLISFENECFLSVYDDRGCDIVFMTYEKMKSFYPALSPFFLAYDLAEMERRLQNRKQG